MRYSCLFAYTPQIFFSLGLCLVLLVSGCTQYKTLSIPQVISQDTATNITNAALVTAAAISIDITPPAGKSMGGYSLLANRAQGFRTRLKARIIYLNDGNGNATALVQTDMTSGSLLLHHMVTTAVTSTTGLTAKDIVITASHSHSSAVNHFNNDFYNTHMSSESGLDLEYLEFLNSQISQGIITAYQQRRPAKIATGKRDIYGYNRNRSLSAYLKNKDIIKQQEQRIDNSGETVFTAVNPSLYMIRVDVLDDQDDTYKPLAAFSSFSVHATALTSGVTVYNADLFAYAQKDLQWHIQSQYQTTWPIVHALTTGTQGDMAPAIPDNGDNMFFSHPVNWIETKKLGKSIGKEAISLFNQLGRDLTDDIRIATAARELDIQKNNKINNVTLCQQPAIGSPLVVGPYEHRTPFISTIPLLKGGNVFARNWFFTEGCQGNKSHLAFKYLQPLIVPSDSFPKFVQFQIIKINDMVILPLPFEVTVQSGKRISQLVSNQFTSPKIKYTWVASNANGYFGYTTTPEEYSAQHYEGGHTLYGKHSTPYLAQQLAKLAKDMQENTVEDLQASWQYQLAVIDKSTKSTNDIQNQKRKTLSPPTSKQTSQEDYISYQWVDVASDQINWHQSLVRIEQQQGDNWRAVRDKLHVINDDGYDLEIRYLGQTTEGMGKYEARWYNPIVGNNYRFNIAARKAFKPHYSENFDINQQ